MRADRLLSILLLLQNRGRTTASALAERLEVSARTIYRDLDALSAAGVPVYAERGSRGGCLLRPGYRTDLTGLNEVEAASLFAGVAAKVLDDLGLGEGLQRAFVKLEAGLSPERRIDVERVRARVHVDVGAWFTSGSPAEQLGALRTAVFADRKVRLTHARPDGVVTTRVVDPLGLVVKGGVWYLIAGVDRALRVFRADRVRAVVATNRSCARPPRFNLATFWSTWSAEFVAGIPQYWTRFRMNRTALPILEQVFGERGRAAIAAAERADGKRAVIRMSFDSLEAACGSLLHLGTLIEVLEPAALRAAMQQTAAAVARLYAEGPTGSGSARRFGRGRGV